MRQPIDNCRITSVEPAREPVPVNGRHVLGHHQAERHAVVRERDVYDLLAAPQPGGALTHITEPVLGADQPIHVGNLLAEHAQQQLQSRLQSTLAVMTPFPWQRYIYYVYDARIVPEIVQRRNDCLHQHLRIVQRLYNHHSNESSHQVIREHHVLPSVDMGEIVLQVLLKNEYLLDDLIEIRLLIRFIGHGGTYIRLLMATMKRQPITISHTNLIKQVIFDRCANTFNTSVSSINGLGASFDGLVGIHWHQ